MSREKSEEFLNNPILTIEDAHRCLSYFGYNGFHLHRERPERYNEIELLDISNLQKRTWALEELSIEYNHIMNKSVDELNRNDYYLLSKHSFFDDVYLETEFKYIVMKLYLSSNKFDIYYELIGSNIPLNNGLISYVMTYGLTNIAQLYCDMAYYRILENHKVTETVSERNMNNLNTVANKYNLTKGSMSKIELESYIVEILTKKMETFVDVDFSKHIWTHSPNNKLSEETVNSLETSCFAKKGQQIFKMEISELTEADYIELMSLYYAHFELSGQKTLLFIVFRFYISDIQSKKFLLSSIIEDPINFETGLINIAMKFNLENHAQYYMNIAYYLIKNIYDKNTSEYILNMAHLNTFKEKYLLKVRTLSKRKLIQKAKKYNALTEDIMLTEKLV